MKPSRASADVQLPASRSSLLTISAFAHAVGLSPSALRQYGENGLLVPADVEERTGYRYYAPDQQQRAIWIRRLRDAGLSMARIRSVLDGDAADATSILREWVADAHERTEAAEELVADLTLSLQARVDRNPARRTCARFDAMVLASGIRQVLGAAGDAEFDGVLIEVDSGRVAVAATDRYVLIARTDIVSGVDGPAGRVCFDPQAALEWLRGRQRVELAIDTPTGRDHSTRDIDVEFRDLTGSVLALSPKPDRFPSIDHLRQESVDAATRVVFEREQVLRLARSGERRSVWLSSDGSESRLVLDGRNVVGVASGAAVSLELSASALARIASAAVGPEIVCDIGEADDAIAWRSPSQSDFVGLVMPRSS